jgi:hypothetical protein
MVGESGEESVWNEIHIWSGSLLLLGAAIHLGTNWDWVKAAFSRPACELKQRVRLLRCTDLWLFFSGILCTAAGVAWMVPGISPEVTGRLSSLHRLTGMIMILAMVVHMLQHRKWMVQTVRWMRDSQEPKADERLGEAQA